ncbi:hypothetical protein [Pollutibacter soli]|uniref:hypothetical protein n=1 Tax=Pollutibacter soli TaxID=3034157 RepID=UPI0030132442
MRLLIVTLVVLLVLSGCSPKDPKAQYSDLVRSERAKNIRVDSIFFGYYFGMPRKEFYEHSWELNRKKKVMDGVNNIFIVYGLRENQLKEPGSMNFFPEFHQERIFKMRAEFAYDAWAPWNKKMYADSLLPDVVDYFETWFPGGNPFLEITDSVKGTIYVKVDGNRRIVIGRYDERIVKADFTDLTVEDEILKASRKNEAN